MLHLLAWFSGNSTIQGDERDVILLSMVASKGAAPTQVGRMYEQRYNVALSRARDRMVLFRSLESKDVSNRDDMKVATIQFFQRMAALGSGSSAASSHLARRRGSNVSSFSTAMLSNDATAEGQVLAWLDAHGTAGEPFVVHACLLSSLVGLPPLLPTGFQYDASCSIAGSLVVVEDSGTMAEDRRLCVCLDGGAGTTLVRVHLNILMAAFRFAT